MFFDKIVEKLVEKAFGKLEEQIFEKVNTKKELALWVNSFEKAVELSDVFSKGVGKEISSHRSLTRYYHATFDPVSKIPNVENLIISLGMEFLDLQAKVSPEVIIGFGSAIMKNCKRELYNNKTLKIKAEEKNRVLQNIDYLNDSNELKQILSDKQALRIKFFKGYEHTDGFKKIKVWLPRPDESWIRWEKEHSVDIKINPMVGMDLGFFRLGYNYSLINDNEDDRLKFASISSSKTKETGEFKFFNIGEKSGQVFWAR